MKKLETLRLIAFLKHLNTDTEKPLVAADIQASVEGMIATAKLDGQHLETWYVLHSSEFSDFELSEKDEPSFYFIGGETFAVHYSAEQDYFENLNPKPKPKMKKPTKGKTPFTLENLDLIIEEHTRQVKLLHMSLVYNDKPHAVNLAKQREAKANVEAIEAGLSILVFGHVNASFTECLNTLNK
jgi:hypothetical protein